MDMRKYLVRSARELTEQAPALPTTQHWQSWQTERRQQFWEMLGIDTYIGQPRPPLKVDVTRVHQRDGYRIECLSYESLPGMRVEANLYVPTDPGPHPGILYVCGHSDLQKASHYQQHARRYAQLGFVTLIVDTIQLGEVRGYHHGTYRYGWFHWISRGFTPAGAETWNGIRGLDLLASHPEVDSEKLGVTGTSGGGAMSWWIAAADERVQAASPSCGTSTIASHVEHQTLDGHCDCMFPVNLYGWSLVDMAALVAPRPVLIVSANRDSLFHIDAIHDFHQRLDRFYEHIGHADRLELFTFRGPHSYRPASRRKTFQWFLRHLQGRDVPRDQIDDIDDHVEEPPTLQVYVNGLPKNNRATTVHDWFVPRAKAPRILNQGDLGDERERVVARLRETAFQAFPDPAPNPGLRITQQWLDGAENEHTAFTYKSEPSCELNGMIVVPSNVPATTPTAVELIHPDDTRWLPKHTWPRGLPRTWTRVALETRGTGNSSWNPGLQWHIRRAAALTGQTVPSMRVFDALQGLQALRGRPELSGTGIYLVAKGEMTVVALYTALLDPDVRGLILVDPPATHNTPGNPDGTGPSIEMIGALRVTDLPYVAGLLWPRELVFVGGRPESYLWAEELYERLGQPGGWWHVSHLEHWRPALDR